MDSPSIISIDWIRVANIEKSTFPVIFLGQDKQQEKGTNTAFAREGCH